LTLPIGVQPARRATSRLLMISHSRFALNADKDVTLQSIKN